MPLCLIPLKLFFFFIGYVIFWLYGYLVVTNYMASLKVFALNYLLEESVLWLALPFPVHLTIPFPLFISSFFKQLFSIPFHLKSIIKHVHDSFLVCSFTWLLQSKTLYPKIQLQHEHMKMSMVLCAIVYTAVTEDVVLIS